MTIIEHKATRDQLDQATLLVATETKGVKYAISTKQKIKKK